MEDSLSHLDDLLIQMAFFRKVTHQEYLSLLETILSTFLITN